MAFQLLLNLRLDLIRPFFLGALVDSTVPLVLWEERGMHAAIPQERVYPPAHPPQPLLISCSLLCWARHRRQDFWCQVSKEGNNCARLKHTARRSFCICELHEGNSMVGILGRIQVA